MGEPTTGKIARPGGAGAGGPRGGGRQVAGDRVLERVERLERELEAAEAREALARWQWLKSLDGGAKARYLQAKQERRALLSREELLRELDEAARLAGAASPWGRRRIEVLRRDVLSCQGPREVNGRLAALEVEIEEIHARQGPSPGPAGWRRTQEAGEDRLEEAAAALLLELAALRNQAARAAGFPDYYTMSLALEGVEEGQLKALLAGLARATETEVPRFGEASRASPALEALFAGRDPLPAARAYFDAIGLSVEPALAHGQLGDAPGASAGAWCIAVGRGGEVRLYGRIPPDFTGARTLFHLLGRAVYHLNLAPELPPALRVPPHPMVEAAAALLFERLLFDPRWLAHWTSPPQGLRAEVTEIRSFARTAWAAGVRWRLVLASFEQAFYRDSCGSLHSLWRRLLRDFLGDTAAGAAPGWACAFDAGTASFRPHAWLMGMTAAAMLAKAVEEELGEEALVSSAAAGYLLIDKWFLHGARVPWDELVRRTFGRELDPEAAAQEGKGAGAR